MKSIIKTLTALTLLTLTAFTQASPVATVQKVLSMQNEAIGKTTGRVSDQFANTLSSFVLDFYEIEMQERGWSTDFNDENTLINIVDAVYDSPGFGAWRSFGSTLNDISQISEDITLIEKLSGYAGTAYSATKAMSQLYNILNINNSIASSDQRAHILANLIAYGSGNNNAKHQLKLDVTNLIKSKQLESRSTELLKFLDSIVATGKGARDGLKEMQAVIELLKPELAHEHVSLLKQGELGKLYIQDYIIERWEKDGVTGYQSQNADPCCQSRNV